MVSLPTTVQSVKSKCPVYWSAYNSSIRFTLLCRAEEKSSFSKSKQTVNMIGLVLLRASIN